MKQTLSLGYSTCPNDTFIFYALAHNLIDCGDLRFDIHLADVETLNQNAKSGKFDVSKLSFAAMGHLQDKYAILRTGAALGRGCGPLIVAKPGIVETGCGPVSIHTKKIAVPGIWTTACMLLSLYLEKTPANLIPMPFDQIMPSVAKGDADIGVIIHEGRFTYKEYGLVSFSDLGKWWEQKTSLPIPLGCIAVKRDIPSEIAEKVEKAIRDSVTYSFHNKGCADKYIRKHAQEMSQSVIQQHIALYVNDFTLDLGNEGNAAVETLFRMAQQYRIINGAGAVLYK